MKTTLHYVLLAMLGASIASCSSTRKPAANGQPNGNRPSVNELFAQMDSDKDGKLSTAEVKGPLANDFSKIDTNSDGFISKEELTKAPKPTGQRPPQQGQGRQQEPPGGRN